jgi:hypothetical protein
MFRRAASIVGPRAALMMVEQSVGSSMAQSVGSSMAQSVGSSMTPSVGSSMAQSVGSSMTPSVGSSMTPNVFTRPTLNPIGSTIFNFKPPISAPTTPEDVLKIMQSNSITIEDLQKITSNPQLVENMEQAVERAFDKQPSVNWKEMREMQNRAYQAFNKINVFTHAWKKFVEDECANRLPEDQDKCFAIRGFAYISFMVCLIILKMVDSHNKKIKVSESELVNVANTVVSGLVVDRILPSQLQNVIVENVNKLLSKQRIVDNQVNRAIEK